MTSGAKWCYTVGMENKTDCPFCNEAKAYPLLLKSGEVLQCCESCYEDGTFAEAEGNK